MALQGLWTSLCSLLALAHVHECMVIHFDVKPDNIVIDEAGVLRLIDFGLTQSARCRSMHLDCT